MFGWVKNIWRGAKENDKRPEVLMAMRECVNSESNIDKKGKPLRATVARLVGYHVPQKMVDSLWDETPPGWRQPAPR